jgi:hypothetical protein
MNDKTHFLKKYFPYILVFGLFLTLFVVGVLVYKDFGVPVDEIYQLQVAIQNHRYIFNGDPSLLSFKDRYYGVTFELPLLWIATRFSKPEMVPIRHLSLYMAFLASLIIFYFLSRRLFHNPWWGLLSVCLLALSPRIFADAFYNSKDIAFMDAIILAFWTLLLAIDAIKKDHGRLVVGALVILHAVASAFLIATRVAGVMIVPVSVLLIIFSELRTQSFWKSVLFDLLLYLIVTVGLTILFFPVLWHNPLQEFLNAFQQMSNYVTYGKAVLYLGEFIPSEGLPWHYLPVWIGISTPIVVLLGFLFGIGNWIGNTILALHKRTENILEKLIQWISDPETLHWLAVIGWLVIPLISIYLFHSVLYNGWRHMFFIFPAIVLFSVRGFSALHKWLSQITGHGVEATIITVMVLAIGLFEPTWFLIRNNPYGNVYFNQLAGDPNTLRQRFELDYWGLSYKKAIDYILATDPSEKIPIYMADVSGLDYINSALSPEQKSRFVILDSPDKGARYFIGNFSFHPEDYYPKSKIYYSINVRGAEIIVVYQFQ